MSGWLYQTTEQATAPDPTLAMSHRKCQHCGAAFIAEVVAQHEALCDLKPAEAIANT